MKIKMICQDIMKNKAVTCSTMLFVATASLLLSLAAVLTVNLSNSIEKLMANAKTPHFMQMHSGSLDKEKLEDFAKNNADVDTYQVLEFLNIDGKNIVFGEKSLAKNMQDNGFSVQSDSFDYLLDLDNQIAQPKPGQLYVPVCYLKDGTAKQGGSVTISGKKFTIAGFIRDSQMNSALASSKRFIIHEDDYAALLSSGSVEYLIEFRLHDIANISAFESAYSNCALPANGPTLTWPLFRMINAISDGIMIAVIFFVSILVIVVAFLCIRFTLLAKIEDDIREIGVMKALGIRVSDIRSIYLATYTVIAGAGCIIGYLLSFLFVKPMTENIRLNFGTTNENGYSVLLGFLGVLLVFFTIHIYVHFILNRFKKISPVQAIRTSAMEDHVFDSQRIKLSRNRVFSVHFLLAAKDVLSRKRLYVTMLTVIVLSSFIMIVPQNLYHTISGDNFVTYIGVGRCDMRMDIQQTKAIPEKTAEIGAYMENDPDIAKYTLLITKIFKYKSSNGNIENIKVELGDHTAFPVEYSSGSMPSTDSQIALSSINAEELNKKVGDTLTLLTDSGDMTLTVCGIYSDMTNGGKTAKASFVSDSTDTAWSVVCASLLDNSSLSGKINEYSKTFDYAKVCDIDEFTAQTFGQTLMSVRSASYASIAAAVCLTLFVTYLFIRLLSVKDRRLTAVMETLGFTKQDIRLQYTYRSLFVLVIGVIIGTVLAGTLGGGLAGIAISSFGADTFRFTINPVAVYIVSPLIMLCAALFATILGTLTIGKLELMEWIKE